MSFRNARLNRKLKSLHKKNTSFGFGSEIKDLVDLSLCFFFHLFQDVPIPLEAFIV